MRHHYDCPMRWADMDVLGHVNNVVYADYLQEARVDMLRVHARGPATGALAEAMIVVNNRLVYVEPLVFDGGPVSIECWVTQVRAASATLAYEVFRETPEGRTVYLTASTVLAPYIFADERPRRFTAEERSALAAYLEESPATLSRPMEYGAPHQDPPGRYPLRVRFSDVDVYGHVNNVKYFEFFQEARVSLMAGQVEGVGMARPSVVVAQQDIAYHRPILFRAEPYECRTWIGHLGTRSMVLEAEIRDTADAPGAGQLLARGRFVMVFFDPATGRSTAPPEEFRQALMALV